MWYLYPLLEIAPQVEEIERQLPPLWWQLVLSASFFVLLGLLFMIKKTFTMLLRLMVLLIGTLLVLAAAVAIRLDYLMGFCPRLFAASI